MKLAVNISRIVTCAMASLYTLPACWHVAQTARYMCYRITPVGEEYVMGFDSITAEAWLFIISGVVLLALCAVTVVFLFRKGIPSAVIAATATVAAAIYGMSLNTRLSEFTLWREIMRVLKIYGMGTMYLSIKNVLALLSILSVVCYFVLYIISYKKSSNAEEDLNEQNS